MTPNQWLALTNFHTSTFSQKMEMLLAQREALFQRQHELFERRAVLEHQMRELIERQTIHELQSRLFWYKLRRAALEEQKDETLLQGRGQARAPTLDESHLAEQVSRVG